MSEEISNTLEEYFTTQKIPFNKNKLKAVMNDKSFQNDFIIPGAIVKYYSSKKFNHASGQIAFEKFLAKVASLFHNAPANLNLKIYVYLPNLDSNPDLPDTSIPLVCVNDLTKIIPETSYSVVPSSGILLTFATISDEEVVPYLNPHYNFITTEYQYQRATTYMTDDEISKLKRIPIQIVEETFKPVFVRSLTSRKIYNDNKNNYLDTFPEYMKFAPLPGGTRKPIKLIKNITQKCHLCDEIYNLKYITDDICFKCVKKTSQVVV